MAYIIILVSALLSSCSAWDLVKPSSGLSVETEIVAGDKQQEVATGAVVGKKETTNNTAETIQQTYHTVDEGLSIWDQFLMLLMSFLLGWLAMPDAIHMWQIWRKRRA